MTVGKTRVGVLMDSLESEWWLTDLLAALAAAETIELYLLLNESHRPTGLAKIKAKLRQVGFFRLVSIAVFNTFEKLERKLFSVFSSDVRSFFVSRPVDTGI